jgi:hypothetical protein
MHTYTQIYTSFTHTRSHTLAHAHINVHTHTHKHTHKHTSICTHFADNGDAGSEDISGGSVSEYSAGREPNDETRCV